MTHSKMQHIYISRHPESNSSTDISADMENNDLEEMNVELPVDIARVGDHLIIQAPMVGAKNDDISITVNNDILYIHKTATTALEERIDNYYVQECHWGSIAREVQLPVSVDPAGAKASLQDGILKIILPIITNRKTRIIKIR